MVNWREVVIYKTVNGRRSVAMLVEERAALHTYKDTGRLPIGLDIEVYRNPGVVPQHKAIDWNGFG